jgi:hypothetical protein
VVAQANAAKLNASTWRWQNCMHIVRAMWVRVVDWVRERYDF